MKRQIVLLMAAVLVLSVLLTVEIPREDAAAVSLHIRPDLPPGTFVARVYYDNQEDIGDLVDYDVWEYNNLAEKYVLVALDGTDYIDLERAGWTLQVDLSESLQLAPTEQSPFEMGYGTVDEYYSSLEQINSQYPQLTELVAYGESSCLAKGGCTTLGGDFLPGYDLLALRISNEEVAGVSSINDSAVSRGTKPVFFLLANIHAREITTPEIAIRLIGYLLENYGNDANVTWLVDWHEIWVVPVANPDGHWLVELGAEEPYDRGAFYQRKNANLDVDNDSLPDCSVWPPETSWQYGVDLNRNHAVAWGTAGSSDNPCSQTFRGQEAESESEVASLQSLIQLLIPDQRGAGINDAASQSTSGILLTLHNYGNLLLWPWGYSENRTPNHYGLKTIGDKLASFNGYRSCQTSICLYTASGTTDDWAYSELGIPAFTYEIGTRFMPEHSEIDDDQWPQNLPSLLYAIQIARAPYEIVLGPSVTNIESSIPSAEGGLVTVTAIIDNSDHEAGQVTAASFSIDLPFWAPGAVSMSMNPIDGSFDGTTEAVTATLPMNSVDPGGHILFVQGQNSEGHWGTVRASFMMVNSYHTNITYTPVIVFAQ